MVDLSKLKVNPKYAGKLTGEKTVAGRIDPEDAQTAKSKNAQF
jgi:hypothetical protein